MTGSLPADSPLDLVAETACSRRFEATSVTPGAAVDLLLQRISQLESKNHELQVLNQQLQLHLDHLAKQVLIDPLTGLANRRYINSALDRQLSIAGETGQDVALLLCDIDHFKHYNDTYGHGQGDTVLVHIGGLLKRFCRREGECAARYGGEEFALLLPGLRGREAVLIAEHVRKSVAALPIGRELGSVTVSVGVTSLEGGSKTSRQQFVEAADIALYRAKGRGRNRTKYQKAPAHGNVSPRQ